MSPEQIRGQSSGPASDLYGLGVLLFEMLTGHTPFQGATPVEIVPRHLEAPIPDLHALARPNDGYREIRSLVMALLSKNPEDRPPVEEVLHILSRKMELDEGMVWSDESSTSLHERPTLILSGERETLSDALTRARDTHLEPFLLCGICHCLNGGDDTECIKCGNELSGVPVERSNNNVSHSLENPIAQAPIHRKVSLLHVHLEPISDAPSDWRDKVQQSVDEWSAGLEMSEGVICHSSEDSIRIVFGLYEAMEPAPVAIREATRLQELLLGSILPYAEFAMAVSTDSVFMEDMGLATPDWALRGAKVDIVTRMVKMAAPTTLLIDEKTLAAAKQSLDHKAVGSILPRGAEHREPLHAIHP